jgi:hypothetical protein
MNQNVTAPFVPLAEPGRGVFIVWSAAFAPAGFGLPAQYFLGEWTSNGKNADLGVWEPETGKWRSICRNDTDITNHLFVDPYRAKVYLSGPKYLQEIDRATLDVKTVAELPRHYTADFDAQGRIWLMQTRSLACYDPRDGSLTKHENVVPEEFNFPAGTHASNGLAPDGRVWFIQFPKSGLSVYDPVEKATRVLWRPGDTKAGVEAPVVIGNTVWAGGVFFDATTLARIEPAFETGPEGFRLMMRGRWDRTPTRHLDHGGKALVTHGKTKTVGWLEVGTGKYAPIGEVPKHSYSLRTWEHLGGSQFVSADRSRVYRIDLEKQSVTAEPLGFTPESVQRMYHWTVGPDDCVYGSGMSHDLWRVDKSGKSENVGDPVQMYGGELHAMTNYKEKLFIAAYTDVCVSRVDTTKPLLNFGRGMENNPRLIHDSRPSKASGQHRPRGMVTGEDGYVYLASCSDYCPRTEGALFVINGETEVVEEIIDPLIPGEQVWPVALNCKRGELYAGTSEGTFVVIDTKTRKIKKKHKFAPRPGVNDGEMTSAMIKIGGIRYMDAAGDLVVGNRFGGMYPMWIYNAATGEMQEPVDHPLGRLFYVMAWKKRGSLVLRMNGSLYEMTQDGKMTLMYEQPFDGVLMSEDSDGRLYIGGATTVYVEAKPWVERA